MHRVMACLLAASSLFVVSSGVLGQTLDAVKKRGELICGVNEGLAGFAIEDAGGSWTGFDVDFCRAVAVAVLNDASKVQFVPLSTSDRFEALRSRRIDLLARNSTWTLGREADYGINFAAVTYFDGQGFMVPRSRNVSSALELGGSKVCVLRDTTSERNQKDYFTTNNMAFEPVRTASVAESLERYGKGECDVMTSDVSQLYATRLSLAAPGDHLILPDIISKEPLAPAVRQDDPAWRHIVEWVHFAMLDAEELGVSNGTLEQAKSSDKPAIRRLLGVEGDLGSKLGLSNDWVAQVIGHVGNYSEVYERNLGTGSKLGIPRGLNQLWNLGGIQYAPPLE
jgi:general L-amino acid transport system substrate-binding protein